MKEYSLPVERVIPTFGGEPVARRIHIGENTLQAKEQPWKPFPVRLPKTPKEVGDQDEGDDRRGGGKQKEKQIQKNVPKKK